MKGDNILSKKRLIVAIIIIVISISYSISAFGYSGVLDTFSGWDVSNGGIASIDDYALSDGDMYVEIRITDSSHPQPGYEGLWDRYYATGCRVEAQKHHWLWGWQPQMTNTFYKDPWDMSYEYLSYTGLDNGTYRLYFSCTYAAELIDFDGTVYDDN